MPTPLTVGKRLGPYEIVRLLGRGGMGEVYLALDDRLRRQVALKLLREDVASDPTRRARFEREGRLAAALHHSHICTIYEISEWEGLLCIAMEYVEGTTLEQRLATGPLSIPEALRVGMQCADALEAAREAHVVHRDLKSANIVVSPRGDVKILDFGLAKSIETPGSPSLTTAEALSEAGVVLGTVGYMAPEQVLGHPADHRSDLFSFGVVLYETLAGRRPFAGATSMTVFDAILRQSPAPIARFNEAVSDPLARVVTKLLEKDPARRYQTAQDVYHDLERLQRESEMSIASGASSPPPRSRRWTIGAAAAVILGVGSVAAWQHFRSASSNHAPSIVVLPAEISGPPNSTTPYEYLRDAVPATLSTRLATIEGLETKVPPTSVEWEAARHDVQQVVRAYAVSHYLSPHVYAEPNRLAMTLQLVQSDTRRMIWSHDYSGTPDAYLTLIGQAADDVQRYLRLTGTRAAPAPAGASTKSDAELAFQEGLHAWNRYNNRHDGGDFELARAALVRSLELDPTLADAASALAALHIFKAEGKSTFVEERADIDRWTREALRIDPRNGMAFAVLSFVELLKPQMDSAAMLDNALRGAVYGPRLAIVHNLLGIALGIGGANSLKIEATGRALAIDPLYRAAANNRVSAMFLANRSAEVLALIEDLRTRMPEAAADLSRGSPGLDLLADVGRTDEAAASLEQQRAGRASPVITRTDRRITFEILARRGDPAADRQLSAVLSDFAAMELSTPAFTEAGQRLLPFLTRPPERLDAALRVLQLGEPRGWLPPYDWLALDERCASLRADVRFAPFLEKSKARLRSTLDALDRARQRAELPSYLEGPLKDLHARLKM